VPVELREDVTEAVPVDVTDGVTDGVPDFEGLTDGVPDLEGVPVREGVTLGVLDFEGVPDVEGVTEGVPVKEAVPVLEAVAVIEDVSEGVPDLEGVTEPVPLTEGVRDGVPDLDAVPLTDGVKDDVPDLDGVPLIDGVTEGVPVVDGVPDLDGVPVTDGVPVGVKDAVDVCVSIADIVVTIEGLIERLPEAVILSVVFDEGEIDDDVFAVDVGHTLIEAKGLLVGPTDFEIDARGLIVEPTDCVIDVKGVTEVDGLFVVDTPDKEGKGLLVAAVARDAVASQEGLLIREIEGRVDTVWIDGLAEILGVYDTQAVTLELSVAQDSVEVAVGAVEADTLYVASGDML